jgi:ubiquinone/menaquinone biosynthesis C-methylase UbiE
MIPRWFFDAVTHYRAGRIADFLAKHLSPGETVLDCGCGSMLIADMLRRNCGIRAFGSDVIHLKQRDDFFCLCSGERLAFADGSFDTTCLAFVLHHVSDPIAALRECLRVTRKRLIVLEDVYQSPFELELLKLLDYHGNRAITKEMSFPFNFKTEMEWREIFKDLDLVSAAVENIRPNQWRPSRHRMFVVDKRNGHR